MNFFSFLKPDEIRYVHEASLEILQQSGLPVIATASSAPDIVDPLSGQAHRATSDEIALMLKGVRAEFDGLVAGDSMVPQGWQRQQRRAPEITRQRRVNRRRAKA